MDPNEKSVHTYTFSLRIEKDGRPLADVALEAKDVPEEIANAKRTIRRLMDDNVPTVKVPEPIPVPGQEAEPEPPVQASEGQPHADQATALEAEPVPAPASKKKPKGAKGLLQLRCDGCGRVFGTFLRERKASITCKCGHEIDLTVPMAKFSYICPYCERHAWGQTNLETEWIITRCKCGGDVDLNRSPKSNVYRN